jgi:proteasome assembly chaperone (PAC2) family protein
MQGVKKLDKPYVRQLSNPEMEKPTFIQGLPGFGDVGRVVAHLLTRHFSTKPFAELYSPTFPDYVSVSSKGTCRLPRYEFSHARWENMDFVIMSGETQPSFDDVLAHYDVCGEIVNYIEKLGCQFVVTIGGVPVTEDKAQIYVAASSSRLAVEFTEKGASIYKQGKIVGGTGLTLALAKERGLEGVCLLGSTRGFKTDKDAGMIVFKFLLKALGKEIKEGSSETN